MLIEDKIWNDYQECKNIQRLITRYNVSERDIRKIITLKNAEIRKAKKLAERQAKRDVELEVCKVYIQRELLVTEISKRFKLKTGQLYRILKRHGIQPTHRSRNSIRKINKELKLD